MLNPHIPSRRVVFLGRKAFTLVEMLVVISIIAILVAFALPGFNKALEGGRSAKCLSQLRSIGVVFALWENDHKYLVPASMSLQYVMGEPGSGSWFSDNTPLTPYLDPKQQMSTLAVCPDALSNKGFLTLPNKSKGFPYICNYSIMIVNPGTPAISKFQYPRRASIVRLMDTNKNAADWGAGVSAISPADSERDRAGFYHNAKAGTLWVDGHVSLEVLSTLAVSRNFRPDQD